MGETMSYLNGIKSRAEQRAFLIGRIDEANYWIDYFSSLKGMSLTSVKQSVTSLMRDDNHDAIEL